MPPSAILHQDHLVEDCLSVEDSWWVGTVDSRPNPFVSDGLEVTLLGGTQIWRINGVARHYLSLAETASQVKSKSKSKTPSPSRAEANVDG